MNTQTVVPCILPHKFGQFAMLLASDEAFPRNYASWLLMNYRNDHGRPVSFIDVDPVEFLGFCRNETKEPSLSTLMQFAAATASQAACRRSQH